MLGKEEREERICIIYYVNEFIYIIKMLFLNFFFVSHFLFSIFSFQITISVMRKLQFNFFFPVNIFGFKFICCFDNCYLIEFLNCLGWIEASFMFAILWQREQNKIYHVTWFSDFLHVWVFSFIYKSFKLKMKVFLKKKLINIFLKKKIFEFKTK